MNEIEKLAKSYQTCRLGAHGCNRLIDLLLAERDSLERVVSAPEARAATSAAEADLGPVSAPGARLARIAKELPLLADKAADQTKDLPGCEGIKHALLVAECIIGDAADRLWIAQCRRERDEADRAPVGAQVEPSRRANGRDEGRAGLNQSEHSDT